MNPPTQDSILTQPSTLTPPPPQTSVIIDRKRKSQNQDPESRRKKRKLNADIFSAIKNNDSISGASELRSQEETVPFLLDKLGFNYNPDLNELTPKNTSLHNDCRDLLNVKKHIETCILKYRNNPSEMNTHVMDLVNYINTQYDEMAKKLKDCTNSLEKKRCSYISKRSDKPLIATLAFRNQCTIVDIHGQRIADILKNNDQVYAIKSMKCSAEYDPDAPRCDSCQKVRKTLHDRHRIYSQNPSTFPTRTLR